MNTPRALHVAALPFPSYQGTQALIDQILKASIDAGHDAQLLCYAERGRELAHRYAVHRAGDLPGVSALRSGPSLGKLLLDVRLAASFERLRRTLRPDLVVAHHVEAAAVCMGRGPLVFFAHTDLGAELPSYAPRTPAAPLAWAGHALDRVLGAASTAVATVSPWLAQRFARMIGEERVRYVPPPWPLPEPIEGDERSRARRALGLPADARVALYAGNLDGYQSWRTLLEAFAQAHTRVQARAPFAPLRLLVATASDPRPLHEAACRSQIASQLHVLGLDAPDARRLSHAAADFAIVPRAVPGGLPIKLLDALSFGLPCALMPAATGGLALGEVCAIARDPSALALAAEIERVALDDALRARLSIAAREHIAQHHSRTQFLAAFEHVSHVALHK